MAGETEPDKDTLLAEIAASRTRLSEAGVALSAAAEKVRKQLNVSTRAKASFQEHKAAWLGGAGLLGFVLSKIPARKKTVVVERGGAGFTSSGKLAMLWGAAKFAGAIARPFLGDLTGERLVEMVNRFTKKTPPPQPPGGANPS